jgi:RNA polymerase sigma factor (sigma-70 family)
MLNIHREIIGLMPEIRRTIAKVLRNSRYYADDHVDECMADVMAQICDYGVRTFDASKGAARSHFTCFAKSRAINWLNTAHRRFEVVPDETTGEDGEVHAISANVPTDADPLVLILRAEESARVRTAIASLEPRERALLEAFERTHSWSRAAQEIGVSAPTATRMKAKIAAKLR